MKYGEKDWKLTKMAEEIESELLKEGLLEPIIIPPRPEHCEMWHYVMIDGQSTSDKNQCMETTLYWYEPRNEWLCGDCRQIAYELYELPGEDRCQWCDGIGTTYPICDNCLDSSRG